MMNVLTRLLHGVERRALDSRTFVLDVDRGSLTVGSMALPMGSSDVQVKDLLGAPDDRARSKRGIFTYARAGLVVESDDGKLDGYSVSLAGTHWYQPGARFMPFLGAVRFDGNRVDPRSITVAQVKQACPGFIDESDDEEIILTCHRGRLTTQWEFTLDGVLGSILVWLEGETAATSRK